MLRGFKDFRKAINLKYEVRVISKNPTGIK